MRQTYILILICLLFNWSQGYSKTNSISKNAVQSTSASALFIENKGQVTDQYGNIRNDIQYKLTATKGLNLFIGIGGIHYQWYKAEKAPNEHIGNKTHLIDINEYTEYNMYRMDVELIGASALKLNDDGSLTATTPMGTITEAAPISFTDEQINVATSYELNENIISYNIGSYIGNLTIDQK